MTIGGSESICRRTAERSGLASSEMGNIPAAEIRGACSEVFQLQGGAVLVDHLVTQVN